MAVCDGGLRSGISIVEVVRGSTGSSLAFVCAPEDCRVTFVTSDAFAPRKLRTTAAFGAELIIEPSVDGQITDEKGE